MFRASNVLLSGLHRLHKTLHVNKHPQFHRRSIYNHPFVCLLNSTDNRLMCVACGLEHYTVNSEKYKYTEDPRTLTYTEYGHASHVLRLSDLHTQGRGS